MPRPSRLASSVVTAALFAVAATCWGAEESSGQWIQLFNGKDLTGWTYRRVETLCSEIFEWDGNGWRIEEQSK
jgi:hypothetical protein